MIDQLLKISRIFTSMNVVETKVANSYVYIGNKNTSVSANQNKFAMFLITENQMFLITC